MRQPYETRDELFRESYATIRRLAEQHPEFVSRYGTVGAGMDMLPKPVSGRLPLLVTGSSQQTPDWIAAHGDGWMTYPRGVEQQSRLISDFRRRIEASDSSDKPVVEPFYLDLAPDPNQPPIPIHLGLSLGVNHLRGYLKTRQRIGVNHVAINLRFNRADTELTFKNLADDILPEFNH